MKKFLALIFCASFLSQSVYSNEYTQSAITKNTVQNLCSVEECEAEIIKDYSNDKLLINLVNAYCLRAKNYGDKGNYNAAADDYRAALFYMVYYSPNPKKFEGPVPHILSNLQYCLKSINYDTSNKNRYNTAISLMNKGKLAAAGFEFSQVTDNSAFNYMSEIMTKLGNLPKANIYSRYLKYDKKPVPYYIVQDKTFSKYIDEHTARIKRYWNPSKFSMTGDVKIVLKIDKQGRVLSTSFLKSSGNKYIDKAAYEAIIKAKPFNSLPKDYNYDSIELVFTFNDDVSGALMKY